ncbi:nucleopolyhedrovirus P10 family protein [Streptomyces gilvus]|uniref:nucleopolyhedrovirus P10 family protein n=1 Tax=Streptomyces gilvus TaxID=2920937 RepID=UPI001F0FFCB7|nr:nucleopolyhedrovirus P10 family protein [Streptomyces sp. CME 23]MCH5673053.1 nucleopolyhedrovirus P10 family protein [Streptomyces sp. CME 23]
MTADGWARTVRHRLGVGRLLPLGAPGDGAWIAEEAAAAVLRHAAAGLPAVRLDVLRIALTDPEDAHDPVVPPPPSALPPGPLRITADFAATTTEPLPTTATLLRTTLATAATELLGLTVTEVDLRVTELLDEEQESAEAGVSSAVRPADAPTAPQRPTDPGTPDEDRVAAAVLTVPGVTRLTSALGRRAVRLAEDRETEGALPRRHAHVEFAVDVDRRALDVAREVRTAVSESLPDHPAVTVLVTAVDH